MNYKLIIATSLVNSISGLLGGLLLGGGKVGPVNLITPNLSKVVGYTKYAANALCSPDKLRTWSCDSCSDEGYLDDVETVSSTVYGTYGYVGVNHQSNSIIVSFRDTVNLQNIIEDLILIPQPLDIDDTDGILVHTGFYTATKSVFPKVSRLVNKHLKRNPRYKVIIMGHSLGGAMASISTVLLHHELNIPFHQMELYTYGQPRTGNPAFANYLNRQNMIIARVTREGDPVTQVVPRTPLYAHHHNEIYLPKESYKNPVYCSHSKLEDPECSGGELLPLLTTARHFNYFGVSFQPDSCE